MNTALMYVCIFADLVQQSKISDPENQLRKRDVAVYSVQWQSILHFLRLLRSKISTMTGEKG